jgi:hypothetical protein
MTGPEKPTAEQPVVAPSVSADPGRGPWPPSRIPSHVGPARTSTLVLGVLFLALLALYLNVRPETPATATPGTVVDQPAPAPAPTTTPVPETTPAPTTTSAPTDTSTPRTTAEPTTPSEETVPTPTPEGTTTRTSAPADTVPTTASPSPTTVGPPG